MINLAPEYLKQGPNVVQMQIYNQYRNDGNGLHSFTDQTDGQQYLYSQCEVDYARFIFPCWDQPDIKATW
jgi:aminopeptidase N